MKIKDYKCKCGNDDFFFADEESQTGIYCSYCGKWFKWANKDEKNLAMNCTAKTGKWIKKSEGNGVIAYECSECKRAVWNDADHDVLRDYPYCHCGARMECEEE